jgi:hypothetical protein
MMQSRKQRPFCFTEFVPGSPLILLNLGWVLIAFDIFSKTNKGMPYELPCSLHEKDL